MGIDRRAQDLHALQPDPLEPIAEEVERYVAALQEFAESDPDLAGRQAWNQIRLAGMRGGRRRSEVLDSLNRIFRLGTVPEPPLDGPCDGLVVTTRTFASPTRSSAYSYRSGCHGLVSASMPRRCRVTT